MGLNFEKGNSMPDENEIIRRLRGYLSRIGSGPLRKDELDYEKTAMALGGNIVNANRFVVGPILGSASNYIKLSEADRDEEKGGDGGQADS